MGTAKQSIDLIPKQFLTNKRIIFIESIAALFIGWALLAHGFNITDEVSSPILVAANAVELFRSGVWFEHMFVTLKRVMYGFVVTMFVGTILGVITGLNRFWEKAFQDWITLGLAFPSLFAAVFTAMWFGLSPLTPTVAGAIVAFPFLTLEVFEGVRDVDKDLLEMAQSYNVSRLRAIWRIVIQSVLPKWFGGARYSFAVCWKITTLAELVAAESGIGFMIEFEMRELSITGVLTWTILFAILMFILEYGVLLQIEKRVFDWRQEASIGWA